MTIRFTPGRRMFLRGAAGASLAIPLLPSILGTQRAKAAAECTRVFISMRSPHGEAWRDVFHPPDSTLTGRTDLGPLAWQVKHGRLSPSMRDGRNELSDVLSAPADRFTGRVVDSMNVMLGLDFAIYGGHNNGYHLGAYGAGLNGFNADGSWGPSIDRLIAYSPSFYPQRGERDPDVPIPVVATSASFGHVRPKDVTSPVRLAEQVRADRLWSALFRPGGGLPRDSDPAVEPGLRIEAFNDVHEALSRLRSRASAPGGRLSSEDDLRLERHMDGISSLRAHFEAVQACTVPAGSSDLTIQEELGVRASLVGAAVNCGLSQVFTFGLPTRDLMPDGVRSRYRDFHQDMVHQIGNDPEPMPDDGRAWWWHRVLREQFEHAVLPMVEALDFEDATGANVLDSSLVLWTAESGLRTHQAVSIPVVTFGGVDGKLATGNFIDYRSDQPFRERTTHPEHRRGLLYDQLMGTILSAFDVERSEYDRYRSRPRGARGIVGTPPEGNPMVGGYGAYAYGQVERASFYHDEQVRAYADEALPVLWRG